MRDLGLALAGAEEATAYGSPALNVRGKMFACVPTHKSAEPGSLVVRLDIEQRDELVAADPDTYYLTDHYVGHPCVLVRLSRIRRDALKDLLLMSWRFVSASAVRRPKAGRTPT